MKVIISLLILVDLMSELKTLKITNAPQNATKKIGTSVLFECNVDEPDTGPFEWQSYSSLPPDRIYSLNPNTRGSSFPSEKFQQVNTFSLYIANLRWEDGTTYGCYHFSIGKPVLASLYVLDNPIANIMPSILAIKSQAVLTCEIHFGGPSGNSFFNQFPKLSILIENKNLTSEASFSYVPGQPGMKEHIISAKYNYTAKVEDAGKMLKCVVSTINPLYSDFIESSLNIEVPANNVRIEPNKTSFNLDDEISCSANGFPIPSIKWTAISVPSSIVNPPPGQILKISSAMIGSNTWKCTATNILNVVPVFRQITFNVVSNQSVDVHIASNQDNGGAVVVDSQKIGLGVGLGIGLLVLIIIIIIVAVISCKRMQREKNKPSTSVPPAFNKTQAKNNQPHVLETNPLERTVNKIYDTENRSLDHFANKSLDSPSEKHDSQFGYGYLGLRNIGDHNRSIEKESDRSFDLAYKSLDSSSSHARSPIKSNKIKSQQYPDSYNVNTSGRPSQQYPDSYNVNTSGRPSEIVNGNFGKNGLSNGNEMQPDEEFESSFAVEKQRKNSLDNTNQQKAIDNKINLSFPTGNQSNEDNYNNLVKFRTASRSVEL